MAPGWTVGRGVTAGVEGGREMIEPARSMLWPEEDEPPAEPLPQRLQDREWLVSNGLGGYASGTLAGIPTRRYHGLLVAAMPAPLGRMLILNHLAETLVPPDGAP